MKRALVRGIIRVTLMVLALPSVATAQLVIGAGPAGEILVLDPSRPARSLVPYPGFGGGVRVALGDVNGDGVLDIVTAPGPGGGPHVYVFDGVSLAPLASFMAYDPAFAGGVFVASADVNGDGRADIITGAGAGGGPHVEVFSGADLSLLHSFYAYAPYFPGGVSVAAGDVNGDGLADIITGAGPSGGPHVYVYNGADLSVLHSFYAYAPYFPGGVSVAAGDVNGDDRADIITGAGAGGGPHVYAYSGADLSVLHSFYAYAPYFSGGVSVTASDMNGDGRADIVTGPGPSGGPHVVVFSGVDTSVLASFMAFDPTFTGGVFVGGNAERTLRFTSPTSTTFVAGTPGTFTVTTAGRPATLSVSGTLPAGVTFVDNGDGTGTLSGTPPIGAGGAYPLTFTADGGVSAPVTQAFTLTVHEAPAITSANTAAMTIGAAATFTITTTGFPEPTLTLGGAALPAGVTFVDNGDGTGTLGGTPAAEGAGIHAITFTADNGVSPAATQSFTLTVSGAPTFTSAATATFTAGSPGNFSVTTAGTPTAALSVAGTLPAGVTFVDNGTGAGTLSGTPAAGTGGTYPLTFSATNSEGSATQSFTLTVQQAPSITSAAATTFTVGSPGTFTVTTTGLPVASVTLGGTLPAGVTFVNNGDGTGTLSGTPAAGTGGSYAITFTASNSVGASAPQAFTLTVNSAPVFTSAAATTFALGVAGSFTVTTVGAPPATLSVGALPGGVTFVDNLNGTGTLSGTPAAGTAGPHTLTFAATNGVGGPVSQTFTLTITEGPVITSASSTTFAIGALNTFTVTASGFPFPSLVQGGAALPSGVTWLDNGNGTGTLSGTPAAGTGGDYALTFTASNGSGSAVQNFTLTVAGSPGFTSAATTTFSVGTPGTFTVTAIGAPAPAITVSGPLPVGVTFVDNGGGSGTLSGTPAAGTGGTYTITFTAANGVPPDGTQAFTLIVNEGPAITSAATATFTIGLPGSFTVTTSGLPLPTLAIGGVALPAGVTFADNGNGTGTLSGTPAGGTGGTYALSFTATNTAGASAPQAFTLTVNGPPSITSANATAFAVGTPGTFTVTTIGFPLPSIARGGVALPSGVTFVDNGNGTGTLSGTPAAGTGGSYAITFTATNSGGSSPAQAFTLTVTEALTITSANATTFLAGTLGTFTVTTTGFPVPTLTLTAGALPAGVTFTDNGNGTATLSGTASATGVFTLEFTAANGAGAPAVQSFTLTVNQAPSFTSADATTFTEDVPGSFTVTTQGTPTPKITATGTLPAGVTFTDNGNGTATLAGTAAAGGTFPLTLSADNGVGSPVTQAFTLTVNEVNDAPSFVLAGAPPTVAEDAGPQTVAAFATLISAGPANEAGQALTFLVQNNSNPGLFSIVPAVSTATGALTYTSAPNAFGTATITLVLQDNGGTANGGVNTSAAQMFTITVLPVNDAPIVATETFQLLGNTELRVDMTAGTTPHTSETTTGVSAVEGVLDNDGDPEGDPIAVTAIANCTVPDTTAPFDCTLTGGAVVHVAANGEFSYTPAPGATTGSFTYTVTDTPAQGTAANVNGTVTFTFFEMIWYVDADAAAGGNGTSRLPFNTFTAGTLSGANGAGDLDDGDDYIFVHVATAAIGAGIELEAGQHLISEAVGLSIPVNLNLNGSPTIVVTPTGSAPVLNGGAGNAVAITGAMASEVRGFALSSTGADAIDVTTAGALTGSPTLTITNNLIFSAGGNGIDVNLNAGTTGTLTLVVQTNTWNAAATHTGSAVDINRAAGTLNLAFSGNTNITSNSVAVLINGGAVANTTITAFANNTIDGNTAGAGVSIANATFDAVPGGGAEMVAGGVLTIGASGNPIGGAGITLNTVQGSLFFADLDVFAGNAGLAATGTGTGLALGAAGTSTISTVGGPAVNITLAAITLPLNGLSVTNTTTSGVALSFVSGTFSAPAGSTITKNGGGSAAFIVNNTGGGTTVLTSTYAGTIVNTSGIGGSVSVTSADAGSSVSFTGAITDNPGTGISLTNNTGATVSFSGGLTLSTGINAAFTATGGGTVTVTGSGNTITTTTGTALNVANTTIGASGLTFRSISANGGANGIVLNTTGTSGGLTVTGNGGVCTSATPTCTGGRIQNTVGADSSTATPVGTGIVLNSTRNVSLALMRIDNHSNFAIRGTSVEGFTMANTVIDGINGNNDGFDEGAVSFTNLTGSASVTNSSIAGAIEHNMQVLNSSGTLNRLTVSGTTFGAMDTNFGSDGLLIESSGTAVMNVTVDTNTFTSARGDHFQYSNTTAAQAGDVVFTNNTITNAHPAVVGGGGGIRVVGGNNTGQNGNITFNVSGNSIRGARGTTLAVNKLGGTGTYSGTIANNILGATGVQGSGSLEGSGIFVLSDGGGTYTASITGNTVRQYDNDGIFMQTGGSGVVGSGTMNVTATGNTVTEPETQVAGALATNGFHLNGGTTVGDTYQICLNLSGNTLAGSGQDTIPAGSTFGDFRLRQRQSTTVRLPGYAGGATDVAAVVTFIQNQNPGGESGVAAINSPPGGGFLGGAACPTP